MNVDLLVPVLARPQRVRPLIDSITASAEGHSVGIVFLCSPEDEAEIDAVRAAGLEPTVMPAPRTPGDYSRKINRGARSSDADWLFLGADDLHFHPGWIDACLRTHERSGALVIGTNDLGNPLVKIGRHATHSLVHRDYLALGTIDDPTRLLHEGYRHNCNPPEARIWMADLSFKSLGEIETGDEVMGWQRPARDHFSREEIDDLLVSDLSHRKVGEIVGVSYSHVAAVRSGRIAWDQRYRPWKMPLKRLCGAEVLSVMRRQAPLVCVVMESGREFRCTPDHLWFNGRWSPSTPYGREWIQASVGRMLLHVIDEPRRLNREEIRIAGWLGGIYDGEGSGVYAATQSLFRNPEVCEAITERLAKIGLAHSTPDGSGPGVKHFSLLGGRQSFLDFLTWCKPVKSDRLKAKILNSARFGMRDKVISVEPAGSGEVISMMTTTGNYVAWGYASKNCVDCEFVETAAHRGQWAFARDAHVEHLHPLWKKAATDATYALGQQGYNEDLQLLRARGQLWQRRDALMSLRRTQLQQGIRSPRAIRAR